MTSNTAKVHNWRNANQEKLDAMDEFLDFVNNNTKISTVEEEFVAKLVQEFLGESKKEIHETELQMLEDWKNGTVS